MQPKNETELGYRKIRSAGARTGSIEMTFPPEIAVLEGVECSVSFTSGITPQLSIQLNTEHLIEQIEDIWAAMTTAIDNHNEARPFPRNLIAFNVKNEKINISASNSVFFYLENLSAMSKKTGNNNAQAAYDLCQSSLYLLGLSEHLPKDSAYKFASLTACAMTGDPGRLSLDELAIIDQILPDQTRAKTMTLYDISSSDGWKIHVPIIEKIASHIIKKFDLETSKPEEKPIQNMVA